MDFKNNILKINFYLLLLFPLSLVFSRFVAELIVFITILNLFQNYNFLKNYFRDNWFKFFVLFYLWLVITTLQQHNIEHTLKSIAYIRFLLFSLGIVIILDNFKKFNLFLLSIFVTIFFVQFDILIQFFFGKDLFGYVPSNEVRFSGPFGDELIAGGFMTKFLSITFFCLFLFLEKRKIKNTDLILSIYLFLSLIIIFLTGERMSMLLALLIFFVIFILEKRLRNKLFILIICFSLILSYFVLQNEKYYNRYIKQNLIQMGMVYDGVNYSLKDSIYFRVWVTGINFIKQKPITGSGLKFYYHNCNHDEKFFKNIKLANCIHPHNIYLDLIGATGMLGLILFFSFLVNLIFVIKSSRIKNLSYKLIFKGSLLGLLILFWPLKTSGAFFNNFNSLILFTIISILITNYKLNLNKD